MSDLWYGTSGPHDAPIVIVGEAFGREESAMQQPFVGQSGQELQRICAEAGLDWNTILKTNIIAKRPQNNQMWRFFYDRRDSERGGELRGLHPTPELRAALSTLYEQLRAYPRRLVIGAGNYPLWALSPCSSYDTPSDAEGRRTPTGIARWRGSMYYHLESAEDAGFAREGAAQRACAFLPILHPAAILRDWSQRAICVHDLKSRVPKALVGDWRPPSPPTFLAPPSFAEAQDVLTSWLRRADEGPLRLANDIETLKGCVTCTGFADSPTFAMSIPFILNPALDPFWDVIEEMRLVQLIRALLLHKNVQVEGQNYLYDTQYIQHWFGVTPKLAFDTMLAHHLLFPGTPKRLEYIASLYCEYYWFWKDDSKEWDITLDLSSHLSYNCMDCIRTFEAATALRDFIPQMGLSSQWQETLYRNDLALRMMNRGVKINRELRGKMSFELSERLNEIYAWLERICPSDQVDEIVAEIKGKKASKTPWYTSPDKQKILFGEILGLRLPSHRKTGNTTLGKDALRVLPERHPEYRPLFDALEAARSIANYNSHFLRAALDEDGRMRCSYGPAGTETFRFNSSKNVRGRGTNLQNIPKGTERE